MSYFLGYLFYYQGSSLGDWVGVANGELWISQLFFFTYLVVVAEGVQELKEVFDLGDSWS